MRLLFGFLLLAAVGVAQNPITPVYPSAIPTDSEMLCWKNGGITQLNGSINSSTLTVVVDSATNLCAPGVVTVGSERMKVCSIASNTLTICSGGRGFDNSTAASHSDNDVVSAFVPAYQLNRLAAEIKAIATALGVNLTNVLPDPGSAGIVARKSDDTVVARIFQGTADEIDIANPAGDGGNPTFSLPATINATAASADALSLGAELDLPLLAPYTVATLQATLTGPGRIAFVTDGAHPRDCVTGGGSDVVICLQMSTTPGPSQWEAIASLTDVYHHATDCTATPTSVLPRIGDLCFEVDDETVYLCKPAVVFCSSPGDWVEISGGGGGGVGDVTAAADFANDNRLIRSDGIVKGVQASGCTLDDSGNLTCPGSGSFGGVGNIISTTEGATADANETTIQIVDPTADRTITLPDATGTVSLLTNTETLTNKTLTSPAVNSPTIATPTVSGAVTGSGTHYYDWPEISAPSSPGSDVARVYAKTGATTSLCMKDSAGTETCFGAGGGGSGDLTVIASSVTANTNGAGGTVTHADVTVPADTFAAGDTVRVTSVWTKTGTTDTWNPWVAFGASGESGTGNAVTGNSAVVAGTLSVRQVGEFQVLTTTSQDGFAQIWKNTTVTVQADIAQAEDVTAETHFYFRNTCTSASDDCTLVSYLIERIR